jgi:hypothetical protein
VLLAVSDITTCHNASKVYGYQCFIIVVEELASRSYQLASTVSLPPDDVDPHIGSPSATTCLMCQSLSSALGPHYVVEITIPYLAKRSFISNFASL